MISRFKVTRFFLIIFVLTIFLTLSFAQNFENVQIQTVKLTDNVYMLVGGGGNIGVSVGDDGILLVDDQFAQLVEKIKAALKEINSGPIRFVINTHMHYDHVNGNMPMAKEGALIIAHENVRNGMKAEWAHSDLKAKMPPYPEVALPVLTFTDSVTFHFNGDEIQAYRVENAHTDGDTIVRFKGANVIHLGDLYFNGGYPFIDVPHGGSIDGIIAILGKTLGVINADTKVIPGHGPLSNREELKEYRNMLITIKDRIKKLIEDGKTLEEVLASKPTTDFDETHKGMMPTELFVKIIYDDLSKK